jgi:hypothetical protein
VHEPHRDIQPPPLTAGQLRHLALGEFRQLQRLQEFRRTPLRRAPVESVDHTLTDEFVADPL